MQKTTPHTGERIATLITLLVLARHGKAPKTSPDQQDEDRTLSELGIAQAKKLRAKLEGMTFDTVLSSPLVRARDTVAIAIENKNSIVLIDELTCPTDGIHPVDTMFNELGYRPLQDYFDHQHGDHLKAWGITALEKVLDTIEGKPGQKVLIVGHAVLQNALAWALCEALRNTVENDAAMEIIMETPLGEGEAFALKTYVKLVGGDSGEIHCEHIKQD